MSDEWINLNDLGFTEINFSNEDAESIDIPPLNTLRSGQIISLDFVIQHPDRDLLGLLTGGVMGNPPEPTFAIECTYPIKRTFWQWLRRKPRQYGHLYIPHARLEENDA